MRPITFQVPLRPSSRQEAVFFPWTGYDFGVPGLAAAPAVGLDGKKLKRRYRLWRIVISSD